MVSMQRITPNLWFNNQAEQAVKFYTSIFKNSKVGRTTRYGKVGFEHHHQPEGSLMTIEFELEGQKFIALNAGPEFPFTEAISFIVNCDSQEEVDFYWNKLSQNGDPNAQMCGWLKDQFNVSWQIVPRMLSNAMVDPEKAELVMEALFSMKKPDIDTLYHAYKGKISTIS
jgi:predicted 3-demethylubiquinone-9 3-methyltransferase (glyoxalase superfamily)